MYLSRISDIEQKIFISEKVLKNYLSVRYINFILLIFFPNFSNETKLTNKSYADPSYIVYKYRYEFN